MEKGGQLDGIAMGRSQEAEAVEMFGGRCCSNQQKQRSKHGWAAWAEPARRPGSPGGAAAPHAAEALPVRLRQRNGPPLASQ